MNARARWVLAFDASCGTCREISRLVAHASEGKLEILPLAHTDVRLWRERSLGSQPPWRPTLIRIHGSDVRAWTGAAMGIRLGRRLGIPLTIRLVRLLGQLSRPEHNYSSEQTNIDQSIMGRAQFLRLGTGAMVAAGLILAGRTPALADGEDPPKDICRKGTEHCDKDCHKISGSLLGYKTCRCIAGGNVTANRRAEMLGPGGIPIPVVVPQPDAIPVTLHYFKSCIA